MTALTPGTTALLPVYDHDHRIQNLPTVSVATADLQPGDATVTTRNGQPLLLVVVWTGRIVGKPAGMRNARLVTYHPESETREDIGATLAEGTWTVIRSEWGRNRAAGPTAVQDHARLAPGRTACASPLAVHQVHMGKNVDADRILAPVAAPESDRWCGKCLLSLALTAGHAHAG